AGSSTISPVQLGNLPLTKAPIWLAVKASELARGSTVQASCGPATAGEASSRAATIGQARIRFLRRATCDGRRRRAAAGHGARRRRHAAPAPRSAAAQGYNAAPAGSRTGGGPAAPGLAGGGSRTRRR